MPQMFPMNWTLMFMIFLIMYTLVTIFTNFIYYHKCEMMTQTHKPPMTNWTW